VFALGADVIAGFPGETADDHAATLAVVESLPFTYLHVFPYSLRPGTAAERLGNHVAGPVADARAREIRAVGERRAEAHSASRVGAECDLIVIGAAAREGITEDYLTVSVSADVPRGTRTRARLERDGARLLAVPLAPIIP
jgi:threonylcarbamoyladenosine tRNA methylthiotransferase MtaB